MGNVCITVITCRQKKKVAERINNSLLTPFPDASSAHLRRDYREPFEFSGAHPRHMFTSIIYSTPFVLYYYTRIHSLHINTRVKPHILAVAVNIVCTPYYNIPIQCSDGFIIFDGH